MKRLFKTFCLLISISVLLFSSCSKPVDSADQFVGIYNVNLISQTQWGSASGPVTDSGLMKITKTGVNKVQLEGFISTTGNVVGNTLYLDVAQSSSYEGNLSTAYNPGTLNGTVLTLTAVCTGQLRSEKGVLYPFRSYDSYTCTKQF